MWKVVITEIQDASAIDPVCAPGAFFRQHRSASRERSRILTSQNHQRHQSHAVSATRLLPHAGAGNKRADLPTGAQPFEGLECLLEA